MKIAVFTTNEPNIDSNLFTISGQVEWMPLSGIADCRLDTFEAVFIWGSTSCESSTKLTVNQVEALWAYVQQGGICYGEMLDAYGFPTSRLLGWKQEYPRTIRTMEKLCVMKSGSSFPMHGLLEWSGAYMKGFQIFGERWLDIGHYKATHLANEDEGDHTVPGLIVHHKGEGKVIYAAFPFLQSSAVYAQRPYWLWRQLLERLVEQTSLPIKMNQPTIRIPEQTPTKSNVVQQSIRWFTHSGIMPSPDRTQALYENVHSITAEVVEDKRPDCHAHAALMFHLYGKYTGDEQWSKVSDQLMQHILQENYQDLDPNSASYGFFKWYQFPEMLPEQIFTDDNSWVCLVLLYLYRKTGIELYKERGMLVAEALFNTQQDNGLRSNCLSGSEMRDKGIETAKNIKDSSMNPHFESIAHTAMIQAYLVSKESKYLDAAMKGSIYLADHMDELKFMYSRTSGLNRLLLPLVYLSKHDNSGKIEECINDVLNYLLSHQHHCGAIEEADNPDPEKYGKEDTGVFRYNGEGIADQLYTNNFLLMNAWEGFKQTGNPRFRRLYDQLADYLCSIQIESEDARFHGGWMRAFDLQHREYFGNNGDTGWGPYCIESGWTNAIINSGLLLQLLDESIYQ